MNSRYLKTAVAAITGMAAAVALGTGTANAAITPTGDAEAIAEAIDRTDGAVTGAALEVAPPSGNPAAVSDTALALFPLSGPDYGMLSTGNTRDANAPNDSDSLSTDNGGVNGKGGPGAFDLVTLRVDLDVPAEANCLTVDYRFLTEEFDEFIGSQFNDAFLAELDDTTFVLQDDGTVIATSNFAAGPDGSITTVKSAGVSADNALGTTYDGATPVLRATTPISPGEHSIYLSVFDTADAIYDTTVFVDNLRLRSVGAANCVVGSADSPDEELQLCDGKEPTVFTINGVAKGTNGDDVILGSDGSDVIRGRAGDDTICSLGGADLVKGNRGADMIDGGRGRDDLRGNKAADVLRGQRGDDTVSGQAGEDFVKGSKGDDRLFGGASDDQVIGNQGDDRLSGRSGADVLRGGQDDDRLNGGPDADTCFGGGGNNTKRGC